MVQTTYKNLYIHDAFKDVLKLLMQSFEPCVVMHDISFMNDNVRCRLVRARDDRMTFNAYALGEDSEHEIIYCTCFYDTGTVVQDLRSSSFRLNSNCENIGFSTYRKDSTELLISHTISLREAEHCTLQYPLQEEQVFQELTRFPVPLESDIDLFMNIGSYVMDGITEFNAYSFIEGWIAEELINETNKENMVQSVREALEGLIEVEQTRLHLI